MLSSNYKISESPMLCGSYEAESRKYHKYEVTNYEGKEVKKQIWLVADQENAADNIYFWNGPGEGFGGREITFQLVSGEVLKLKGPWHTNSSSFKAVTGIDITDKHLTWGVLGLDRSYDLIEEVIYKDHKPQLGKFDRIENLATTFSKALNRRISYYQQSMSGSMQGSVFKGR